MPFLIYCDYPLAKVTQSDGCVALRVHGVPARSCRLRLIPESGSLPAVTARIGGHGQRSRKTPEGHREYSVPGGGEIEVHW